MRVQWVTQDGETLRSGSTVQWGTSPPQTSISGTSFSSSSSSYHQSNGTAHAFTADTGRIWWNHVAEMTGLEPGQRIYYRVGDSTNGYSSVFNYATQVASGAPADGDLPQYHIVFGDMGSACAFAICKGCTCDEVCDAGTCGKSGTGNMSVGLIAEVTGVASPVHKPASMFLHVGDFGYDLGDEDGKTGDNFFKNIEQLAAFVPYMPSIGNHENAAIHLAHYTERFRVVPSNSMPTTVKTSNGLAPNSWYYSWDDGLVHYVAISTELYFGIASVATGVTVASQYNWLQADLKKANANRARVPWIVVHGHRSMYCSCDGDCDASATTLREGLLGKFGLEELFMDQGVDIFMNGHEHNYERMWPTYKGLSTPSNVDPKAPIYIVTGAAGCRELHEPFTRPQPPRSAFRSNNFGYSRFIVHNATHAHWQQVIMDPDNPGGSSSSSSTQQSWFGGPPPPCTDPSAPHTSCSNATAGSVIDDTWIVQAKHGPFKRALAPKHVGKCTPKTCRQYDHWAGRILSHWPKAHANQTVNLIRQFRSAYGQGKWLKTELNQLEQFEAAFGRGHKGSLQFEDVSADGSSDGKWDKPSWRKDAT